METPGQASEALTAQREELLAAHGASTAPQQAERQELLDEVSGLMMP